MTSRQRMLVLKRSRWEACDFISLVSNGFVSCQPFQDDLPHDKHFKKNLFYVKSYQVDLQGRQRETQKGPQDGSIWRRAGFEITLRIVLTLCTQFASGRLPRKSPGTFVCPYLRSPLIRDLQLTFSRTRTHRRKITYLALKASSSTSLPFHERFPTVNDRPVPRKSRSFLGPSSPLLCRIRCL